MDLSSPRNLLPSPAALFHSLSDPVRLRLLRLLAREELTVQEMVGITGLSQPRVSKHLGILRQEGWLQVRSEGTRNWYRVPAETEAPGGAGFLGQVLGFASQLEEAPADDRGLDEALAARQIRAKVFFTDLADRWETVRRQYHLPEFDVGTMAALAPRGMRVLDVGTGRGLMLPALAAAGARVVALDLSLPMLVRARQSGLFTDRTGGHVAYCCGSAEALPLPNGVFDAVICAMVLHHAARPGRLVSELVRVLKPKGRLALTSFCAHQQEWMRAELAHQWLGFTRMEVEEFCVTAGLRPAHWLQRGPHAPAEATGGIGFAAEDWPDVFLMTGVKDAVDGDRVD